MNVPIPTKALLWEAYSGAFLVLMRLLLGLVTALFIVALVLIGLCCREELRRGRRLPPRLKPSPLRTEGLEGASAFGVAALQRRNPYEAGYERDRDQADLGWDHATEQLSLNPIAIGKQGKSSSREPLTAHSLDSIL